VESDKILGLDSRTKKRKTQGATKEKTNKRRKEQTKKECKGKVIEERRNRERSEIEKGRTELSVKEKLLGYVKRGIKWLEIM
jgi:hypothetical protein